MMKLIPVVADVWKMDGGVSFGVVPKSIWQKICPSDENNMIDAVDRCLLLDTGDRRILIDTGMGRKRNEKYYRHRYVNPEITLEISLAEQGYAPGDITDILFTHLHDDHVGGATVHDNSGNAVPAFPNATFRCSAAQWEWAIHPNRREAATYHPDNLWPLYDSGRLRFIESEGEFIPGVTLKIFNGHTVGQIIPFIETGNRTVVFMGDFIPTAANIPLVYIPAVDIQPLVSMAEKEAFLGEAVTNNFALFLEHDFHNECCTVSETEKGFVSGQCFRFCA